MLVHSPRYTTPLADFGINKPFALDRGQLVLDKLRETVSMGIKALDPTPLTLDEARLVHSQPYLDSLHLPATWKEIFELKPEEYQPSATSKPLNLLLDDILLKSGGTKTATELCFQSGLAANLGGGYHHAFPDQGRGFCVLHDVAIAIRHAQRIGLGKKCMVVDVDFHQGDGTARIFNGDDDVFTLSIHSEEGWPEEKQQSDLDIGIFSSEQDHYLEKLEHGLNDALSRFAPDFVLFVAGSDAYEKDELPGTSFIRLSLDDIRARDCLVLEKFARLGVPLAMVYAGGYGPHVWEVHYWATRKLLELAYG